MSKQSPGLLDLNSIAGRGGGQTEGPFLINLYRPIRRMAGTRGIKLLIDYWTLFCCNVPQGWMIYKAEETQTLPCVIDARYRPTSLEIEKMWSIYRYVVGKLVSSVNGLVDFLQIKKREFLQFRHCFGGNIFERRKNISSTKSTVWLTFETPTQDWQACS